MTSAVEVLLKEESNIPFSLDPVTTAFSAPFPSFSNCSTSSFSKRVTFEWTPETSMLSVSFLTVKTRFCSSFSVYNTLTTSVQERQYAETSPFSRSSSAMKNSSPHGHGNKNPSKSSSQLNSANWTSSWYKIGVETIFFFKKNKF